MIQSELFTIRGNFSTGLRQEQTLGSVEYMLLLLLEKFHHRDASGQQSILTGENQLVDSEECRLLFLSIILDALTLQRSWQGENPWDLKEAC